MSEELKPCPFCGGEAESDSMQAFRELSSGNISDAVAVYCRDCGAQISICKPDVPDITIEQVVGMWNTRTNPKPSAGFISLQMEADLTALRARCAEQAEAIKAASNVIGSAMLIATAVQEYPDFDDGIPENAKPLLTLCERVLNDFGPALSKIDALSEPDEKGSA